MESAEQPATVTDRRYRMTQTDAAADGSLVANIEHRKEKDGHFFGFPDAFCPQRV
jgi:hypothetical protein